MQKSCCCYCRGRGRRHHQCSALLPVQKKRTYSCSSAQTRSIATMHINISLFSLLNLRSKWSFNNRPSESCRFLFCYIFYFFLRFKYLNKYKFYITLNRAHAMYTLTAKKKKRKKTAFNQTNRTAQIDLCAPRICICCWIEVFRHLFPSCFHNSFAFSDFFQWLIFFMCLHKKEQYELIFQLLWMWCENSVMKPNISV